MSAQQLSPRLESAASDALSALAGVDTHDVNLCDHPKAWAAIEAFASAVRADEAERAQLVASLRVQGNAAGNMWARLDDAN